MEPSDIGYQALLRSLELLFPPGRVIEIRILGSDRVSSGYYNDLKKAADDILLLEQDLQVSGIYVTLNEVSPTLLARRSNRIKTRMGRQDATTGDGDIIRRCWLPIDIDPVRASGISSSESEHADALALAHTIATWLTDQGWPDPVIADSGNGAHLLYPIDLPNDEENRILVKSVLNLLDIRFSDSRCKVDTANFNASRIWKVYGTFSRKGDNLVDRPHRRSRILSVPGQTGLVSRQALGELVAHDPVEDARLLSGNETLVLNKNQTFERADTLDALAPVLNLGAWLFEHAIAATARPYQGGTLYSFDQCPFSDAHTDGAFAIQFESGAIFAGCHHDSCGSGRQRWPELRAKYEPQYTPQSSSPTQASKPDVGARLAQLRSERIRAKFDAQSPEPLMDQVNQDTGDTLVHGEGSPGREPDPAIDLISERSREILTTSDPLAYLLETFAQFHEGDQIVAECLLHSLTSRSVINSKGLHVSITGESGKGKSHAIETMKSLIPKEFRLDGRMSDKALFYMDDMRPGTVITLDDVCLSEQMQEILKGVTTSFQKPFPYRTVNVDRKPQICTIPERCIWWIAKVEGAGDDQVFNRMLTCWIDDSEEQDQRVLDRTLGNAEQMPGSLVQGSEEVQVCRKIWEEIRQVFVVIPYARRIRFQSAENRRNPDMLLDLIRTNATLRQEQREKSTSNGITCVVANEDDFNQAARLFVALNGDTGGQGTKLTRRETALIEIIAQMRLAEVTITELQRATGWTNSTINKLLHGYRSYGKTYSGILEKCPAVSFLDRTVTFGDDGYTTLRRARVYLWDDEIYNAWIKGGSVWLAADTGKDDSGLQPPPGSSDGGSENEANDSCGIEAGFTAGDMEEKPEQCEDSVPVIFPPATPESEGVSLSSVRPENFFRIEGSLDRRRCSVCAKRNAQYQERRNRDRLVESDKKPLVLCLSCFQRAVSRAAAAIIPLPGTIHPKQMIRPAGSPGRCQLCNLRAAVWSDPGSRTHLCDPCYHRITLEECLDPSREDGPP